MGRYLSNSGAVNFGELGVGTLRAAGEVVTNDAILVGPSGLGQRIKCTDYAAAANPGQIVAQTSVALSRITIGRHSALVGGDGSIFFAAPTSSGNGLTISRYSATGALLATKIVTNVAAALINPQLLQLSSGNIAVVYGIDGSGSISLRFAILAYSLELLVVETEIEAARHPGALAQGFQNANLFGAVAFPGGFAVIYQQNADPALQRAAWYTNAGAVAVAVKTINTWVGAAGNVYTNAMVLSDGNIAIACYSKYTTTVGLYHAIYDAAGNQVTAFSQLNGATATDSSPEISTMGGYYAVAVVNTTTYVKAFVLSNAGALQGIAYTSQAAFAGARTKLANDGENFYVLGKLSSSSNYQLVTLPVSGGANAVQRDTGLPLANMVQMDVAREGPVLLLVQALQGATANQYAVIDLATGFFSRPLTNFGSAAGGANQALSIQLLTPGDYTFIAVYDYQATEVINFYIGKYAATAIVGVATDAAAAGALFPVMTAAGAYQCNAMVGTLAVAFDHSSTNIEGNTGTVLQNALMLRGF